MTLNRASSHEIAMAIRKPKKYMGLYANDEEQYRRYQKTEECDVCHRTFAVRDGDTYVKMCKECYDKLRQGASK